MLIKYNNDLISIYSNISGDYIFNSFISDNYSYYRWIVFNNRDELCLYYYNNNKDLVGITTSSLGITKENLFNKVIIFLAFNSDYFETECNVSNDFYELLNKTIPDQLYKLIIWKIISTKSC